ncbi:MAG: GNAT family N-acetyltransferase [Flavobacteriales bacterium]|nr:GNAT family N-acetyltransferase [Flavobacteriales bacterium]MCX7650779.1 GNAT family N-acetyltransferase [Flavobacteriales bacterium]MDW8431305.1 GNAT family N-acetyltransferase [Flavobacteriales bacterium]
MDVPGSQLEISEVDIRDARPEDMPALLELIRQLAAFEKAPEAVTNSIDQMLADGFGPRPLFKAWLAWYQGTAIGMAVVYYRYSTWRGKSLFLEDLYVEPAWRGRGLGRRLLEKVVDESRAAGCGVIQWQVLDWNTEAIAFYDDLDVQFDPAWVNVTWPAPFKTRRHIEE